MKDNTSFCNFFLSDNRYVFQGKDVSEACCLCGGSDFQFVAPSELPSDKPSILPSESLQPTFNGPSSVPSESLYPSQEPSTAPSICIDEPGWKINTTKGFVFDIGCEDMDKPDGSSRCEESLEGSKPYFGKVAYEACCTCGGGDHIPVAPSQIPSVLPSDEPSVLPSDEPSVLPSDEPSVLPSDKPSVLPSDEPSVLPSDKPSVLPSDVPSVLPSDEPSVNPSAESDGDRRTERIGGLRGFK